MSSPCAKLVAKNADKKGHVCLVCYVHLRVNRNAGANASEQERLNTTVVQPYIRTSVRGSMFGVVRRSTFGIVRGSTFGVVRGSTFGVVRGSTFGVDRRLYKLCCYSVVLVSI